MHQTIRARLYTMLDLALAFATLEAVRLPLPAGGAGEPFTPCRAPGRCDTAPRHRRAVRTTGGDRSGATYACATPSGRGPGAAR